MIRQLCEFLSPAQWLHRVQWPTREPRPPIYDDGRPTVGQMLRALPEPIRPAPRELL